jgi:Na+-transporting NADH:ubiquinone oxidoreductase subunit NqrA
MNKTIDDVIERLTSVLNTPNKYVGLYHFYIDVLQDNHSIGVFECIMELEHSPQWEKTLLDRYFELKDYRLVCDNMTCRS